MPTASITPSGPRPSVISRMIAGTSSCSEESIASMPWRRAISSRSGTLSTPITVSAPLWRAIRAHICPIGPRPKTATLPPFGIAAYSTACQAVGSTSERKR